MTILRSRIEQLEGKVWQNISAKLDRYLAGCSVEDVEFFCVHGYLPETPMPGHPYHPSGSWPKWKEHKRAIAGRTEGELEFFCAHGYWPKAGGGNNDGNP